jgi:spore germination protein KA
MQITHENFQSAKLDLSLEDKLLNLRTVLGNTMDLNCVTVEINGVACAVVTIEGMVSTSAMSELVFHPMMSLSNGDSSTPDEIMDFVLRKSLMSAERVNVYTYGETVIRLFSGFALIFVDGISSAAALGIQGYDKKSISSPTSENNVLGSQEAFAEVIRTNISLIRRRLKHPSLRFEMHTAGKLSNTDVCLVYIDGRADEKTVARLRKKIGSIKLDCVLGTGFVKPFVEMQTDVRLFSEVGYTERPDMLCANLIQGRIGILIDGTPFCLVCPQMFVQNFNTVDDYASRTYFAAFLKAIRYLAFFLATAFPGIYLAAVNFNPEILNLKLLSNLSASEKTTMLPLFGEMVIIMMLLEIMREASIRLPHAVGTAMSIAGGLIIGDAAVKSGIISSPLLIIVGITATASFVLPSLSQQTSVLRLMFIIAGGFAGFFGITACAVMTVSNICSQSFDEVPYTSPLSPFCKKEVGEVLGRKTFAAMQKETTTVKDYKK